MQLYLGFYFKNSIKIGGPGSSVGIATGYGLDGPGIEFRRGGMGLLHLVSET
jgi:hypothetical protein